MCQGRSGGSYCLKFIERTQGSIAVVSLLQLRLVRAEGAINFGQLWEQIPVLIVAYDLCHQ